MGFENGAVLQVVVLDFFLFNTKFSAKRQSRDDGTLRVFARRVQNRARRIEFVAHIAQADGAPAR